MPTYITTPINVAPGTLSTWTDVDLTTQVGAFTTTVKVGHLRVVNVGATDHAYNVRSTTSTDDRTAQTIAAHTQHDRWVGVNAGDRFQAWVANAEVEIYLISFYVVGEADFLPNAVNVAPVSGAWNDVDVSALTTGTALAACLEIVNTAASDRKYSIRMNGSTDDRSLRNCQFGHRLGAIAPLDGAEIFEMKNDAAIMAWFSCYILSNVVFQVNATDVSETSFNVYVDRNFAALMPVEANGVFLHFYPSIATPTRWAARADGSTFDKYEDADLHVFVQVPTSARVAEIEVEAAHQDTFFLGYSLSSAVSDSAALTGVEGIGSPGTVTALASAVAPITSIAASGGVGTVAVLTGDGVSVLGVQAAGSVGTVVTSGDAAQAVTGVTATAAVGTLDVLAGQIVALTGVGTAGSVGALDSGTDLTVVGLEGVMGVMGEAANLSLDMRIINPLRVGGHVSYVPRTSNVDIYQRQARP